MELRNSMNKIPTGVKGLNEMLDGGYPKGRTILIRGGPGTGKTIFSLQFLSTAIENGTNSVYVSLEEPVNLIKENLEVFGWNLDLKEKDNKLRMLDFYTIPYGDGSSQIRDRKSGEPTLSISREINNAIDDINAECVVIDPLTSISIYEDKAGARRHRISELFNELKETGCTALFTSELESENKTFSMEEFLADGVIRFDKTMQNFSLVKTIRIVKMRGVKYDEQPRRYTIDSNGIIIYSTEPVTLG
jgi:circadian clock protein KaiC